MNVLKELTIKDLKLNKKRTIVTIIGIMLSVALITAVATIYSSGIQSLINFEVYQKGDFHVAFYDISTDEVSKLKNNRKIENIFITQNIGYAKLEDSKNEYKPYAFVKAFTQDSLKNLSVKLVEGRLPEKDDEIVIPTHLKTNGRVELKVGDSITLNIGKRISEGQELTQNDDFDKTKSEEIVDTVAKTYKIVGIVERPATNIEGYSAPGYTFITYINEKNISGNVDSYCKYTKDGSKAYLEITANILGVNKDALEKFQNGDINSDEESQKLFEEMSKAKYKYNINQYLIELETNPLDNNAVGGLGTLVIIVCLIIVFSSVFCIRNSFDISISEKVKQYGMLKSIGATKKQIRKNVFFEATVLGIIGIPLGLLAGILASAVLVGVSNYFLDGMYAQGLKLELVFSWKAFAVAIILGIVTIYMSALRSARRTAKISPIESIRNSGNVKITSKKVKSPAIIKKLFGIGGEISYKNIKRNKKKYRTTVISITVSVAVFIALYYFMSMAFLEVKNEIKMKDYNLSLLVNTGTDEQMYQKIKETTKLDGIKKCNLSKYDTGYIESPKYTSEYIDFMKEDQTEENNIEQSNSNVIENGINSTDNENIETNGYIIVRTMEDEQYKEYIKKLGLKYENVQDKAILINNNLLSSKYDSKKGRMVQKKLDVFNYKENDKINCKTVENRTFEIKIGKVTSVAPFGFGDSETILLISDTTYEKYFKTDLINVYYDAENPNQLQDSIDEILNNYNFNVNNISENASIMEKLFILVGIFLYGFIIVITLIGITNIFNTITTSMQLRKQEFAMLKSVGMTTKEFNRMIRLETVFIGVKSLIFSIPMGLGLSYLIYNSLEMQSISFQMPIKAVIIAIIAVFLLITCIMKYSMNKINKQNTIETIRNENI